MKTVHLALALALNRGTDPPDVMKTLPCARMECWIAPEDLPTDKEKAGDLIAQTLQEQVRQPLSPTSCSVWNAERSLSDALAPCKPQRN